MVIAVEVKLGRISWSGSKFLSLDEMTLANHIYVVHVIVQSTKAKKIP